MIHPGLGAVANHIVRGVRHVLFGILDGLVKLTGVKLDQVNCRFGKNGESGRPDLGEAAPDEEALMFASCYSA